MIPQPTVGRIVRYVDRDLQICAAIIVKVWSDTCVNLTVFTPNGTATSACSVSQGLEACHWHWPERT